MESYVRFYKKEIALMRRLNTPAKVQDFLNAMPFNFEKQGKKIVETLRSPLYTLRAGTAHCFEGALLGAYILSRYGHLGHKPLVLHLKATKEDYDHVITPFKVNGLWGALSKTNHAVLRYREPIYKNIHELVMSYFHEYFLNNGQKTLRQYSTVFNLNTLSAGWESRADNLWDVDKKLDKVKHFDIIYKAYIKKLRKADNVEVQAGKIVEYKG